MSGFQRFKQQADAPEVDTLKCHANGCRLTASVSLGGGPFNCRYHAFAESDQWPLITRRLGEHDWLLGLMADMGKMERRKDWREYATRFWAEAEPGMIPHADESRELYAYRLHLSLAFRVGARTKAPLPQLPQGRHRKGGNMASLIAAGA